MPDDLHEQHQRNEKERRKKVHDDHERVTKQCGEAIERSK